ncbi:hypothetical protein O181_019505 [Austropuccinia psidii MF-1]|uniref:Reverse transcriptase Ty1/copia-type domain-containing protein n=1 Tax=Austropuccinia psidii MF-1 TaxID=1389203 RepID=A0A9Q3CBX8_9BASI|nr:hypothetical protein [Austropuccinia psidii MF-1]
MLCAELNIKWLDMEQQIVGLKCGVGEGEVTITQRRLTDSILDTYLRQVLRHYLPLPVLPVETQIPDAKVLDPTTFCSVIGSLAYLVGGSRPYLAFAINYLVCHSMGPTMENWELLDHVIGYLLRTHNCGIQLRLGNLSLTLWSNAGWGGDLKPLQIGFIIQLGEAPVIWGSKRQTVVALSTCAAEYVALSDSTQHLVQAINQVTQFAGNLLQQSGCGLGLHQQQDPQAHAIPDQAFLFVDDTILKHGIKGVWVKAKDMQANALTKRPLGPVLLQALPFLGINA